MKKYTSLFRIRFINSLQYRAAAWGGISTQFAWGGMTILMFWAFYQDGRNSFPMEFSMLSSYIWLQQATITMYMIWFTDSEIFESITTGNVAYDLARPIDIYNMWFVKNIALRLSKVVLRCLPIFIFASLLPEPFKLSLPKDFTYFFSFLISGTLSFFLSVAIIMIIYIITFYTLSPRGSMLMFASLAEFLSGALIPIPFFPEAWQTVLNLLPFASIQNSTFLIYVGYIGKSEILPTIALQAFWLVVMYAIGKLLISHALKRVVVQGG